MKKILVFTLIFSVLFSVTTLASGMEGKLISPKSYGLGNSFTAIANDISAVEFNPAGIADSGVFGFHVNTGFRGMTVSELKQFETVVKDAIKEESYNLETLKDLEDTGVILEGFGGVNLDSIALTSRLSTNQLIKTTDNSINLENNTDLAGTITFGEEINKPFYNVGQISYGFNIDMIQHRKNTTNVTFDENKKIDISAKGNSIGVDFGMLAKYTNLLKAGVQIENIFSTDYKLIGNKTTSHYDILKEKWIEDNKTEYESETLKPNRDIRVGGAVKIPVISTTLVGDLENITPYSQTKQKYYHLGLEQNLVLNLFSARIGTFGEYDNITNIDLEEGTHTFGLGINLVKLHLDASVGVKNLMNEESKRLSGIISGNFKF